MWVWSYLLTLIILQGEGNEWNDYSAAQIFTFGDSQTIYWAWPESVSVEHSARGFMHGLPRITVSYPMRSLFWVAVPRLNIKTNSPGVGIRRSWDCLIFLMGIPILLRRQLYMETDPWSFFDNANSRYSIIVLGKCFYFLFDEKRRDEVCGLWPSNDITHWFMRGWITYPCPKHMCRRKHFLSH